MDKVKLAQVAKTLMFEVNDEVLNQLAIEYDKLNEKINNLKKIDVSNIQPLIYVDETATSFLREDELNEDWSPIDVLKNAPQKKNQYVVLPGFIKDQKSAEQAHAAKKRER